MSRYLRTTLPFVALLITQTTHTSAIASETLTDLQASKCTPYEWGCPKGWQPAISYSLEAMDSLQETIHLNPPETDKNDPYKDVDDYPAIPSADKYGVHAPVCAIRFFELSRKSYETQTYESLEAFVKESRKHPEYDQHLTHRGACGMCSSLQDLSVYLRFPDLTDPISACSRNLLYDSDQLLKCIMDVVPFSEPCAMIWVFNAQYTKSTCLTTCLFKILLQEYNNPDENDSCVLNDCLKCDEVNSGPVFKAVAGRTRRASGLMSAIFRPYDTIFPITHCYHLPSSATANTARTAFDLPFLPEPGMSLSTLSCNDTAIAPGTCDIGKDRDLQPRIGRPLCILIMTLLFIAVMLSCCGPRGLCWRCCRKKKVVDATSALSQPVKPRDVGGNSHLRFGGICNMWRKRARNTSTAGSVGSVSARGDWDAHQEAQYIEMFGNDLGVRSSSSVITTDVDNNNNSNNSSSNNNNSKNNTTEYTFTSPHVTQGALNTPNTRRPSLLPKVGLNLGLGSFKPGRRHSRDSVMDNMDDRADSKTMGGVASEQVNLVPSREGTAVLTVGANEKEEANETERCLTRQRSYSLTMSL